MSKARDEYLECLRIGVFSRLVITTYVNELEQGHKQDMITLGDYALEVDRLRQRNVELIETIQAIYDITNTGVSLSEKIHYIQKRCKYKLQKEN